MVEIEAIWFKLFCLLLLGLHSVVWAVFCWLSGFVSFPRVSIAPLFSLARIPLVGVTEEDGVRTDRRREQWSNRSPGEGNKSRQPAKHRPDNRMKTEQEQTEQFEPDGLNFKQQSPDNGRVHRAAANSIDFKARAARGSVCNPLLFCDSTSLNRKVCRT